MKKGLHPDNYRTVLFYDTGAKEGWLIRSCAPARETMAWTDGQTYPVMYLDTSAVSHPVYTGKSREINTEGRASQFLARFGKRIPAGSR